MLRFVQSLRLNGDLKPSELALVANEIYRELFQPLTSTQDVGNHQHAEKQKSSALFHNFDMVVTNQVEKITPSDEDVWIFGYGSLVWKADFPYIDRRRGYICGYKRRFYQHSIDHRGIPEKPGRVVTLLPGDMAVDRVYGVAYRIAAQQKSDVLNHLDYREKNGYERCKLQFHEYPCERTPINVIMYVATQANESYAGDVQDIASIAQQIFTSAGPSGPNREYLFNLAIAMRELFPGAEDEHLTELVNCVSNYVEKKEPILLKSALCKEICAVLDECINQKTSTVVEAQLIAQRLESLRAQCKKPGWRELLLTKELKADHTALFS